MSIRPVDLQIIIPRATEVSKTQQSSDNLIISQQQQFAEQWQQIAANRQRMVQGTSKSEGSKVHRDKEKKDQNKDFQQGHHPGQDFSEQNTNGAKGFNSLTVQGVDPTRGHLIDIKT